MNIPHELDFRVIDWDTLNTTEHKGVTGTALWRTLQTDGFRVRMVDYSPGYMADHWCSKGHIVHCISGELESELQTGEIFILKAGMSYIVGDDRSSHRSRTEQGVQLLIIDGDFLNRKE